MSVSEMKETVIQIFKQRLTVVREQDKSLLKENSEVLPKYSVPGQCLYRDPSDQKSLRENHTVILRVTI